MGILDKLFGSSGNSKEDKLALFVYFLTHLSLADGNVSDEETKYVSGYISRTAGAMSKQKWDRIISKSESLGDKAIKMTMKLDQHDKVELVKELIGIAASDGHFHEAELKWIMVFSVSLGLDPDIVKNEILENIEIVSNEISESTEVIDKVMIGLTSDLIKTVKDYDEVETSESGFAKGWTLNEMKCAFQFAQLTFKFYSNTYEKEENIRQRSIIEFIQMCYKNTHQINSIKNSPEWLNFIENTLNETLTEEGLSILMNMGVNKRLELLFCLKSLTNATIELVQKSDKSNEEINSIISDINKYFSNGEKMFKVSFSKEDYDHLYNKYCDEDERQNKYGN